MYDGVKAMIEAEKALAGTGSAAASSGPVCSRDLKIEDLTSLPTFKSGE